MTNRDLLIYLSLIHDGSYRKIVDAIRTNAEYDPETVEKEVRALKCKTVTYMDDDYPACFNTAICPPLVLYYYGNLELLQDIGQTVTIVGARDASEHALNETRRLSKELAEDGYVIISGLAQGIDTSAHEGAVKYGKTVAILGNGLNRFYPYKNKDLQNEIRRSGLVITEYPPDVPPNQRNFPARNRLIAAAGNATLAMEAAIQSGTAITVSFALHYGRSVGCLPGRPNENPLGNTLIKEGAALIESKEDVIALLNPYLREALSQKM